MKSAYGGLWTDFISPDALHPISPEGNALGFHREQSERFHIDYFFNL